MKILLDSHMLGQKQTGNERYWKNLALGSKKYVKKNHQIILYSNLSKSSLPKEFSNFEIFTPKSPNGLYRIFFGFNQAIKKYQPDLIHVQNFAPLIKTCPIVTTVHDLCFNVNPLWFSLKTRFAFKFFFKRSLDLSDTIICVSKTTRKMLLKYYSVNPKKVFVVYEAADPAFYFIKNKKKLKEKLWRKFKIKSDYFLVVGNVEDRKSSHLIINAFKNAVKSDSHPQLIFAGPNNLKIKTSKNIIFLNYVAEEDLNLLYNGAVSLIFFSLCEGFGLPLVEAMATKTPIIASNIEIFREIAKDAAIFVKDKEELSKAISLLLKNKTTCKKYSLLSFQRGGIFSWEKTVRVTREIYKWALSTKKLPITK